MNFSFSPCSELKQYKDWFVSRLFPIVIKNPSRVYFLSRESNVDFPSHEKSDSIDFHPVKLSTWLCNSKDRYASCRRCLLHYSNSSLVPSNDELFGIAYSEQPSHIIIWMRKKHNSNEVWVFDRLNSISDNEKFIAVDVFNFDSIYIRQ